MNQYKIQWQAVVETVTNNLIPKREGELFETGHSFLKGLYYKTLYVCQNTWCVPINVKQSLTSCRGRIDIA